MITFKLISLIVGAGTLFEMFSTELGQDVLLAIVTCLS
jgi:hypothetical protein